ncbi:hypothetical protein CS542_01930 [Pedobacter sp. IW39]|nr:hypothetical protein CS542_01930 [Pedobacter sp. IW39]
MNTILVQMGLSLMWPVNLKSGLKRVLVMLMHLFWYYSGCGDAIPGYQVNPVLYVIGAYSNWSGATAVTIASVKDDQQYEGYINLDASNEFKFTSAPDFNHINYGTLSPGTFIAGSGDNLKVAGAGYYLLKADTKVNLDSYQNGLGSYWRCNRIMGQ